MSGPRWPRPALGPLEPVEPERVKGAPVRQVPPHHASTRVDKANRRQDVQALRDLLTPGPQRSTVARAMLALRDPSIKTSNRLWSDLRKRAGVVTERWSDGWYLSLPES